MYVCMHVCMYVYVHVYMYVRMYVCTCIYVCMYVCMYMYVLLGKYILAKSAIISFTGFVIAIVRGYLTDNKISETFNKDKVDIPRVPALGLFLESVKYERYNRKYADDGMHVTLDWEEHEV